MSITRGQGRGAKASEHGRFGTISPHTSPPRNWCRVLVYVESKQVEQHLGAADLSGLLEHDLLAAAIRARVHDFAEVLSPGGVPPSRLCGEIRFPARPRARGPEEGDPLRAPEAGPGVPRPRGATRRTRGRRPRCGPSQSSERRRCRTSPLPATPSCRATRADPRYDPHADRAASSVPFDFNTAIHKEPDDVAQTSGCAAGREAAHGRDDEAPWRSRSVCGPCRSWSTPVAQA